MSRNNFAGLKLSPALLRIFDRLGDCRLTAIQAQGLPLLLKRRDLIAQADAGSRKTPAIGILHRIEPTDVGFKGLHFRMGLLNQARCRLDRG